MGMGLQYDEHLLTGIAQEAGGNYYYVDQAESVGAHLDREIDELVRTVASDVELRVDLGEGVEVVEVFGYQHRVSGDTALVSVPDLSSGERRKVVLQLRVSGAGAESRELVRTSLRYKDVQTRELFEERNDALAVRSSADVEDVVAAEDRQVLVKVEVVRNATAMSEAMELQKDGQFQAAQELLAARYLNSKTLNEAEYQDAELTRILGRMKQVMLDLERTRKDASARRDLQLATQLQALGYTSGD